MGVPMKEEDVIEKIRFAELRLANFLQLNHGDIAGANSSERQQLLQEFFFHLVGVTEVLAQLVNEKRGLGLNSEEVSIPAVLRKLPSTDSIKTPLNLLYIKTMRQSLPKDPYSDSGYLFRILNYRHQVTHRRRNPFLFRMGSMPPASFILDPRDENSEASKKSVQEEMQYMFKLIKTKCEDVLKSL